MVSVVLGARRHNEPLLVTTSLTRDHSLGCPTNAQHDVHRAVGLGDLDGAGDVTVADQPDAHAQIPALLDQVGVPRAIQHQHRDVAAKAGAQDAQSVSRGVLPISSGELTKV